MRCTCLDTVVLSYQPIPEEHFCSVWFPSQLSLRWLVLPHQGECGGDLSW